MKQHPYRMYVYRSNGYRISFGFGDRLQAGRITLENLRGQFRWVAMDRIPVLRMRGWRTGLSTPISSFSKGVTFESLKNGRLRIRIKSRFFAINGQQTARHCEPVMDAGSPKGCFFQVRQNVPFEFVLDMPFQLKCGTD